jgi:hypothetical protein
MVSLLKYTRLSLSSSSSLPPPPPEIKPTLVTAKANTYSTPQLQTQQLQQPQQQQQQQGRPSNGLALPSASGLALPPLFRSSVAAALVGSATPSAQVPATPVPLTLEQQLEHITTVEGIVPTLQNIVATVNLDCRLDLKTIALHAHNAEYDPKVGTTRCPRLVRQVVLLFHSVSPL